MKLLFRREQENIHIGVIHSLEEAEREILKFANRCSIPITDYRKIIVNDDIFIDFGNPTRFFVINDASDKLLKSICDD